MGDNCGSNLIEQLKNLIKNGVSARVIIVFILLLTGAFISFYWSDVSITGASFLNTFMPSTRSSTSPVKINCNFTTCPAHDQVTNRTFGSSSEKCPEYFKWIHEDLSPWKDTGITLEMVESADKLAYIRIVVVKGRVYLKKFKWVFQTRDVFNIWGILQLLRLYPGELPDLDIMFECGDMPVIKKSDYQGSEAAKIPPMFHYCGSDSTFDITFPDWSFWGWPELQIQPWETLKEELEEGNHKVKWMDRVPYAYWKGNIWTGHVRQDLVKCNVSEKQDLGALIYHVDWQHEEQMRFKHTNLASQCTHRYKIYAEGNAWSVSEKYIVACDSMSLLITPHYYDFFTRSLIPTIHYWPVRENDKCRSITFAVNWGNNHTQEAQEIGKAGSKFIQEELKMKYVYDYMFHLLYRYGKLLKYQPTVPEGAAEMCLESMVCGGRGLEKTYMFDSMVKGPSDSSPCIMPKPFDSATLRALIKRKANLTKQVEKWEAGEN
ncbi:uncharacterized protein LOC131318749 isoform X1 [Rhododendron vialii]|uniref:uncharacterized protein LOC131318749 isoform X1 n=1 Tax=Rhododendron vialii TaxID=182163 RepID=UPI00265DB115|nr:uncharacterized protein LOC131318749 isoform X1 [Rhododendron vialii]XP_058204700.1 uncharacterized protein LOC131318749 isoform X1 [Rhododendron vialii]